MHSKPDEGPILIADDDPDSQRLLRRLLAKAEVANPVFTVSSAGEAIAFLRDCCATRRRRRYHKPVVTLLDINQPTTNGFDVLRWARSKPALRQMRVVMLSSSRSPEDRQRAMELGADAYLIKFPAMCAIEGVLREATFANAPFAPVASSPLVLRQSEESAAQSRL